NSFLTGYRFGHHLRQRLRANHRFAPGIVQAKVQGGSRVGRVENTLLFQLVLEPAARNQESGLVEGIRFPGLASLRDRTDLCEPLAGINHEGKRPAAPPVGVFARSGHLHERHVAAPPPRSSRWKSSAPARQIVCPPPPGSGASALAVSPATRTAAPGGRL